MLGDSERERKVGTTGSKPGWWAQRPTQIIIKVNINIGEDQTEKDYEAMEERDTAVAP